MARVYSDAGEQLAWIGETIGDDVETYEIVEECDHCEGTHMIGPVPCWHCTNGRRERLRFTRDGKTWELTARRVSE